MDETQRGELTPEKIHHRQVFFRIYLPVIIASLILNYRDHSFSHVAKIFSGTLSNLGTHLSNYDGGAINSFIRRFNDASFSRYFWDVQSQ